MRAIALQYHDIVGDEGFAGSGFSGDAAATYKLALGEFEQHLAAIQRVTGARVATTVDLQHAGPHGTPLLLTFDDGGKSAFTRTADLLERYGWRGHFFVTTNYIGTPAFLDAAEIRALAARGHVIGTHSCSHPLRMAHCSWDELLREWARSVQVLAEVLGAPVTVGSVPGGYYTRTVAAAAALAGVRVLFTSEPTTRSTVVDGCLVVGRYTLRRGSRSAIAARLAAGRRSALAGQWLAWNSKKMMKALSGKLYLRTREALLR